MRDFEWLVIDDGSTDGTSELIEKWIKLASFPIRYFRQDNSGKHIAHNLGVKEARGQFFAPLDSDDAILPNALEKLLLHWNEIPASARPIFAGVYGLCCDQHGQLVGDAFPESPFDGDLRDVLYVQHVRGEKWCMFRTEILRQFPFPEIPGTYIPEGIIWMEIAKSYKSRFVNETVRVYFVDDEETGTTITSTGASGSHANGRLYYYVWLLNNNMQYFIHSPAPFLKAALMIPSTARRSGQTIASVLTRLQTFKSKALVCLIFPVAILWGRGKSAVH